MMERHAKVGKHAVDTIHAVITHEVGDKTEVAVNHRETWLVLGGTAHGIHILVKRVEMTAASGIEMLDYGTGMTSAAVSGVDIDASGTDVKCLQTLGQQGGYVIGLLAHFYVIWILCRKITKNLQKQTAFPIYNV